MLTCRPLRKARIVNSDSANYPTWVPTELDPAFDVDPGTAAGRVVRNVVPLGNGVVPWGLHVFPYGLGASNDAFAMRLVGYKRIGKSITDADTRVQYLRLLLAIFTCTVGAGVGRAGFPLLATELPVDTITVTYEATVNADVTDMGTIQTFSPVNDTAAHILIPLWGIQGYEWEWDQTTNTPTMNALECFVDSE